MPIDLAPYDLILQDWGRPAVLQMASDCLGSHPVIEYRVTVIPQTVRLSQTDTLAAVQNHFRAFLIQSNELPESLQWLDCELIVDNDPLRVIAAEDSGSGGWILLQTFATPPRSAA